MKSKRLYIGRVTCAGKQHPVFGVIKVRGGYYLFQTSTALRDIAEIVAEDGRSWKRDLSDPDGLSEEERERFGISSFTRLYPNEAKHIESYINEHIEEEERIAAYLY